MSAFVRQPPSSVRRASLLSLVPALGRGVRLSNKPPHGPVLLAPERGFLLNETAFAVVSLIDGDSTIDDIVAELTRTFAAVPAVVRQDVVSLVQELAERRLIVSLGSGSSRASRR